VLQLGQENVPAADWYLTGWYLLIWSSGPVNPLYPKVAAEMPLIGIIVALD